MREDMETYDLQLIKLPHDVFCPRPPAYLMVPVMCFEGRNIDNLHTDLGLGFLGMLYLQFQIDTEDSRSIVGSC